LKTETISPQDLAALLAGRDEQAFNYLYTNYSAALYGMVLRIVYNESDACEVLQDVFVKIWNSIDSYDSEKASLYTWMLNIARNAAIDRLKSKAYQNNLKNQTLPDIVHDQKALTTVQEHQFGDVQKGVDTLRDEYKIIIEKAYFGGLTQEEISQELNLPLGTVKTRTRAALKELKKILRELKVVILFFLS